jgi:serine-type D-Ala-D-Ala carboxypeptidase/endopeptidase (penicillin-binding protein 4)
MKIITGAVALAQLGADYRFTTTFAARGTRRDSTIFGDLVVIGRGDPSVSDAMRKDAMQPLREVADSLRARGVSRVTGSLSRAGNAFPGPPLGMGWEWDDLRYPYAAGVDELLFNEGIARITIRGGRAVGDPVSVTTAPIASYPAAIIKATTSFTARPNGRDITVAYDSGSTARIVVAGFIKEGDSTTIELAYRDPGASYLTALREALAERGIVVERGVDATDGPAAEPVETLYVMRSPTLREILPPLMKPSQNQIAEVLLKTLGLERGGLGTADSGARVVEKQITQWGAAPDGFIINDGSGLSRHDYLNNETITRVLDAMRKHPSFTDFYESLPIAGVDGTIENRMKNTPAERNVHAKTGTVDRASSLSGYVTTADGRMLIFSMLSNSWTTSSREARRMQDAIAVRLAALRLDQGERLTGSRP